MTSAFVELVISFGALLRRASVSSIDITRHLVPTPKQGALLPDDPADSAALKMIWWSKRVERLSLRPRRLHAEISCPLQNERAAEPVTSAVQRHTDRPVAGSLTGDQSLVGSATRCVSSCHSTHARHIPGIGSVDDEATRKRHELRDGPPRTACFLHASVER